MMSEFQVVKYSQSEAGSWNDFVATAKNATFLFHRDFMEYHNDRFEDFSLMVFKNGKLFSIMPANRVGNKIHSHQGLTYGGILLPKSVSFEIVRELFNAIVSFLKISGFDELHIKMIPDFYTQPPANEMSYLLAYNNAVLEKRDMVLAIDFSRPVIFHKTKLKHFKKTQNLDLKISSTTDFSNFWNQVLEPRLEQKHQTKPVHSLSEIELLFNKFPNNIEQFDIYSENEIVAGITVFKTDSVVKSQYGATTDRGEKLRALEYLFMYLIYKFKAEGTSFFSMGTVCDSNELGYNRGLLRQKEELGCSVYTQDFYKMTLR